MSTTVDTIEPSAVFDTSHGARTERMAAGGRGGRRHRLVRRRRGRAASSSVIAGSVCRIPSGPRTRSRSSSWHGRARRSARARAPTSFQPSFEYERARPGGQVGRASRSDRRGPGPRRRFLHADRQPAVCVSRWCSVIGPNGSGSPSHGRRSLTETWRSSGRPATSCSATIAANASRSSRSGTASRAGPALRRGDVGEAAHDDAERSPRGR